MEMYSMSEGASGVQSGYNVTSLKYRCPEPGLHQAKLRVQGDCTLSVAGGDEA